MSRSQETDLPDINDFTVEIISEEDGKKYFRDTYKSAIGRLIPLNAGDYTLKAYHGDPADLGFDAAYFEGLVPFTVHPRTAEKVSGSARLSNVKVAVRYGADLVRDYDDFYATVTVDRSDVDSEIRFGKDETRAGYVPVGDLVLSLYATRKGETQWYQADPIPCNANDFVTLTVNTAPLDGFIKVNITIDDSVDTVTDEVTVPPTALPHDAPLISAKGFDPDGSTFTFVEDCEYPGSQVDFMAGAGIAHAYLDVNSDILSSMGLSSTVDLAAISESDAKILSDAGLRWIEKTAGARIGYLDLSGMGKKFIYDSENPFTASFSLRVEDMAGKVSQFDFNAVQSPARITLAASDANAFARRIRGVSAIAETGNPSKVALQYSANGTDGWTDVPVSAVSDNTSSFVDITGLSSSTQYYLRTVYNGNPDNTSEPVVLTTEPESQVGNSGFEEWHAEMFKFTATLIGQKEREWYLPWVEDSDAWWAVNSKRTMLSECTNWNFDFKVFPTVSWSSLNKSSGEKSAQITTVATGAWAIPQGGAVNPHAGELWIGTADNGGGHLSEGHLFYSRPDAISFWYQYIPVSEETYYAKMELRADDGSVIASGEIANGQKEENGKVEVLPLEYFDYNKKASSIYIYFKSSTSSSPGYNASVTMEISGKNQTSHIGSVLRIDDVELIYE